MSDEIKTHNILKKIVLNNIYCGHLQYGDVGLNKAKAKDNGEWVGHLQYGDVGLNILYVLALLGPICHLQYGDVGLNREHENFNWKNIFSPGYQPGVFFCHTF